MGCGGLKGAAAADTAVFDAAAAAAAAAVQPNPTSSHQILQGWGQPVFLALSHAGCAAIGLKVTILARE